METRKPFTQIEEITPQMAQDYLTRNISNRKLRKNLVDLYARQMKEGLWQLSNDAICFSIGNKLQNGQHRLAAVCQSGVPCQFTVTRNLPEDAFVAMDNGAVRTASDIFSLRGVKNYANVSSIIRKYILLNNHFVSGNGRNKISNIEIDAEYSRCSDFYDELSTFAFLIYGANKILSTTEVGGYAAYLVLTKNHGMDKVKSFFRQFAGLDACSSNVVSLLRNAYLRDRLSRYRMTPFRRQKLFIKTWNYWVTGKDVKVLNFNESFEKDIWFI